MFKIAISKAFVGHKGPVYDFAVDRANNLIFSAGSDGKVVSWNLKGDSSDGRLVLTTAEALYSISVSTDQILTGSQSGRIYKIDRTSNALISNGQVHQGGVFILSPFCSGGKDGFLITTKHKIKVCEMSLRCLTSNKSHHFIGASTNHIYALNRANYEVDFVLKGHSNSVFALEIIDKNLLLSTGRDARIVAWDLALQKAVFEVNAHQYQAKSLSHRNGIVLSSSMDKTIKIWNDSLALLRVMDNTKETMHTNCVNKVQWISDNQFVSCSDDGSLLLWDFELD